MNIGIVTDEISRALDEALDVAATWGLSLFELREGGKARFPGFTKEEIARIDAERAAGARITAVSPGIFKGNVADTDRLRRELDDVLPKSLELAQRFEAPTLIVFGFEMDAAEPRIQPSPRPPRVRADGRGGRGGRHHGGCRERAQLLDRPAGGVHRPPTRTRPPRAAL
ncbi:MAG: hypothetical protein R2834_03910 [Rhodothermales bacterium]